MASLILNKEIEMAMWRGGKEKDRRERERNKRERGESEIIIISNMSEL